MKTDLSKNGIKNIFINLSNWIDMESNISRDHIALEAMKCMMQTAKRRRTLWNRVVTLFFPNKEVSSSNYSYKGQAKAAYEIADAMIEERNKIKED